MSRARVFILYSHALFARGVQSLLSREQEVDVIGVERDGPLALETIRLLHPEVILVDSSRVGSRTISAGKADPCLTIPEIFREVPDARVISLNLSENGMDIYDKQRIVALGPEDLVRAIQRE